MILTCPNCNFSKEIDPARLPEGSRRASCPKCGEKFDLPVPVQAPPLEPSAVPAVPPVEPPPQGVTPAFDAAPPPLPPGAGQDRTPIAWEVREHGFFRDLWTTAKEAMFSPLEFFDRMPPDGGYKAPLTFGLISGSLGIIFLMFYNALGIFAAMRLIPASAEIPAFPAQFLLIGMVILAVISPIFVFINLYVGAFFTHVLLLIVRGGGGGYQATFRVVAYSSSVQLLNIVPLLGAMVSGIYTLVLLILGLPKAHNTSVGRVVVGLIVVPFVLAFAFFICFGVLVAILAGVN